MIMSAVKALQAKRLVIDSLTSMTAFIRTKEEARSFVSIMKKISGGSRLHHPVAELRFLGTKLRSASGFEEFVADGLIILGVVNLERFRIKRRLYIPKMRGTNHSLDCHDLYITPEGIEHFKPLASDGNIAGSATKVMISDDRESVRNGSAPQF